MIYSKGEYIECPMCGDILEFPVENYALVGKRGFDSISEVCCRMCGKEFSVENVDNNIFNVEEL